MKKRLFFIGLFVLLFAMLVSCNTQKKVKISFDTQGGSKCKAVTVDPEAPSLELPVPTRDLYKFTGWFTDEELSEQVENPLPAEKYPTEDTTFYAGWEEILYTIFFEVDGKSIFSKNYKPNATVSENDYPSLDDYPGYYWEYKSFTVTGTDTVIAKKDESVDPDKPDTYSVEYFVSGERYAYFQGEANEEIGTPDKPAAPSGYYFVGWSLYEGGDAVTSLPTRIASEDVVYYALFRNVPNSTEYLTYRVKNDEIIITGLTTDGKYQQEIGVPAKIGGRDVTAIGYDDEDSRPVSELAVFRSSALTTVFLPSGLRKIGSWAFSDCSALTTVAFMGSSLSFIGYGAFAGCTALEKFTVTDQVTMIEDLAFAGLTRFGNGEKIPEEIKTMLPSQWRNEGWTLCNMSLSSFNVGANSVLSTVGAYCYYNCSQLTEIKLSAFLGEINYLSFIGSALTSLDFYPDGNFIAVDGVVYSSRGRILNYYPVCGRAEFTVPASVEQIKANAFRGNENLISITLSDAVSLIEKDCFRECKKLEEIIISNNSSLSTVASGAFADCKYLTSVRFPRGMGNISEGLFANDSALETVTFAGNNIAVINARAFYQCTALTSIILPANVQRIGERAFYGCSSLYEMGLDANASILQTIEEYAFCDCRQLEKVYLPSTLEYIGDGAFFGESGTMKMELESNNLESLRYLGSRAFSNTSIKEITLRDKLVTIGEYAFENCASLKNFSFTVPKADNAYTAVPVGFLRGCEMLERITFTINITTIRDRAFEGCKKLSKVTFEKKTEADRQVQTIKEIGAYAFAGCIALLNGDDKSRLLPSSLTTIGEGAFKGCVKIDRIYIPQDLEVISKEAFAGCTKLELISYENPSENKLHTLQENCFAGCTELGKKENVSLPIDLRQRAYGGFEKNPFFGCTSLVAFSFPEGNNNGLTIVDGVVYTDSTHTCIYAYPTAKEGGKVKIANTVSAIDDYAFYGATLTGLEFIDNDPTENSLTITLVSIGEYAFAESSLTSVELSSRIRSVGGHAFENCRLSELTIRDDYYRNGDRTGDGKEYITQGALDNSLVIGDAAFYKTALTTIELPNRITSVGASAFSSCYNLSSITFLADEVLGDTLTLSLGDAVFSGDTSLRRISFPSRLIRLGEYALFNCYNLENVFFASGSKGLRIDGYAISENHFLYEITLPSNIVSLGEGVFANNTRLKYVYFPEDLTVATTLAIPPRAFWDDNRLDSLTVPYYVTEIGEEALRGSRLNEITFQEGIYPLVIGRYAFAETVNLKTILLPNNCTVIGDYAFYKAQALQTISHSGEYFIKEEFTSYHPGDPINDILYVQQYHPATGVYRYGESYYTATLFSDYSGVVYGTTVITSALFTKNEADVLVPATGTFQRGIYYYSIQILGDVTPGEPCGEGVYTCRYAMNESMQYEEGVEYFLFVQHGLSSDIDEFYYQVDGVFLTYYYLDIGAYAFSQTALKTVKINSRALSIGDGIFENALSLTAVELDGRFSVIPQDAFLNDTALERVVINDRVTTIAARAFKNSSLQVVSGNPVVSEVGEEAFYASDIQRVELIATTNVTIGRSAFENCSSLTSVIINTSGNLTLEDFAFGKCVLLDTLSLVSAKLTLGKGFAYNAKSLSSGFYVSETGLNDTYSYSAENILYTGNHKEIVFYPAGKTGSFIELSTDIGSIGAYAFYGNSYLTGVLLRGSSVVDVGEESISESSLTLYVASSLVSSYKNEKGISNVQAFNATLSGFVLSLQTSGKYYITSYLGTQENLTVPGKIISGNDVYEIIGIDKEAFKNNLYVRNVIIDSGIKTISNGSFRGCTALESVYIGENVTGIKSYAFYGCVNLTEVTFAPNSSVVNIGNYAFAACRKLRSISLPGRLETIGSYAFSENEQLEDVNFQEGVFEIKNNAFEHCDSLRTIVFPRSITTLGNYLFKNCDGLIYVRCLSEKVPMLEENTFVGVPDGIFFFVPGKTINQYSVDSRWRKHIDKLISADYIYDLEGETAFSAYVLAPIEGNKYRLVAYIDDSPMVTVVSEISDSIQITAIGENAFSSFVKEVTIGYGITAIDANAFSYATNLERVTLPVSLVSIGSYAFAGLTKLTVVRYSGEQQYVLANSIAEQYNQTGKWQERRNEFFILSSGSYIQAPEEYSSYYNYFTMRSYAITSIADHAFYNCTALTEFDFPNSLKTIGKYAFSCDAGKTMGLRSVIFRHSDITGDKDLNQTISIDDYAFARNALLPSIEFNCYVTYLGEGAFSGCITMTSLYLNYKPSKYVVTAVPKNAQRIFEDCSKLNLIVPNENAVKTYREEWGSGEGKLNVRDSILSKLVAANPFVSGEFVYAYVSSSERKVTVVGYLGSDTTVVFPSSVTWDGIRYTVYRVGRSNQSGTNVDGIGSVVPNNVTRVTIPGSVEIIGKEAFMNCLSLQEVIVSGDGLKTVESYAFANCPELIKVRFPSSLLQINDHAFMSCNKLNGYDEDEDIGFYVVDTTAKKDLSLGSYCFAYCEGLTHFRMPAQLSVIGDHAFYRCSSLVSVRYGDEYYLPDSGDVLGDSYVRLTKIETEAFRETAITEIMLPETVTQVGDRAFAYCQNLLAVYLFRETGTTNASPTVFEGIDTKNTKVYVPIAESVVNAYKLKEGWKEKQVIPRRFYGDFAYDINGGTTGAGGTVTLTAYRGTEKDLIVPNSIQIDGFTYFVTAIAAYFGTPILETVIFTAESHVYKIESYAFAGCTSLKEIRLPGSEIGSSLSTTEVEIGLRAFEDCTSLVDVHLPQFMTYIAAYLFHNCTSLEELTLPATIGQNTGKENTIGDYGGVVGNGSFNGCLSLARLRILFDYPNKSGSTAYGSSVFYHAGRDVNGGLKIIVPSGNLTTYENNWRPGNGDSFSFVIDSFLFGDYLMQEDTERNGYTVVQYRGSEGMIDMGADFAGRKVVSLDDSIFDINLTILWDDFTLQANHDGNGSFTLVEYRGTEDLDLTTLTVLGRKITRIHSDVVITEEITINVDDTIQYASALTNRISISGGI